MTIEAIDGGGSVGATADALIYREVVIRYVGPFGRTVIRSFIVDVAVDEDVEIDVEVDAVVGHSFALSTVTFMDDDDDAAAVW